jgi:hypothetical protein
MFTIGNSITNEISFFTNIESWILNLGLKSWGMFLVLLDKH